MTCKAILGLGSNEGDREGYLNFAVKMLQNQSRILSIRQSSIYETSPWGLHDQPYYLNQVLEILTTYRPMELLDVIRSIEKQTDRQRNQQWGPRSLDIDILLYGSMRMRDKRLRIPHEHLKDRRFALVPLVEINPHYLIPGCMMTAEELLTKCQDHGIVNIYKEIGSLNHE